MVLEGGIVSLVQILECNDTLGTCCNDYGLVLILDSFRNALNLLQILVPIILIVVSCIELIKLVTSPDSKKGIKPLIIKYFAAAICFFVPILMDTVLGMMPDEFRVSSCWEQAKISAEVVRSFDNNYINIGDKTMSPVFPSPEDYDSGNERKKPTPGGYSMLNSESSSGGASAGVGDGSATGKAIVEYAKQFVGQAYVWGGTWNGELPYTGTDCSGFVQGVFKHHGINLTRTTYTQWADTGTYTLVTGEVRAGDLVMYDGHVGILTGNGNELVHAKGTNWGIVVDPDYKTCSSHAILGIMRINGVN